MYLAPQFLNGRNRFAHARSETAPNDSLGGTGILMAGFHDSGGRYDVIYGRIIFRNLHISSLLRSHLGCQLKYYEISERTSFR